MSDLQSAVISLIKEALRSGRWDNENAPGSAHLKELLNYPGVLIELKAIEGSKTSNFYLGLASDIEKSFNDDWLPETLCGLPLQEARRFLMDTWPLIESHGLEGAIQKIKECHAQYKACL